MYNLGLMYAAGEGVNKDLIEGYKWLHLSLLYLEEKENSRFEKPSELEWKASKVIYDLEGEMTKNQVKEGQQRARGWKKSYAGTIYEKRY